MTGTPARCLRVERGEPSPAELAAVTVVLALLARRGDGDGAVRDAPAPMHPWSACGRRLGVATRGGPDAWRASSRLW